MIAYKTRAAVISITETWLYQSVTDSEVNINGYVILRRDRDRSGGGVCLYVREDVTFTPLKIENQNKDSEVLCIELFLPKTKPITVGVCYRPPKQHNFIEQFEAILAQFKPEHETVLLGDFNICYNDKKGPLYKSYSTTLKMFNLTQIIKDPTRVTDTSSTIIDHILCNNFENISQFGVLDIGLSDHSIIFCTRKLLKPVYNKHNSVKVRSVKSYDKNIYLFQS